MNKKVFGLLIFLTLAPVFYFWVKSSGPFMSTLSDVLIGLGRLFGLLAVYAILLQFMMMGRAKWVESAFGLDKLSRIHRLNGFLSFTFIVLHPVFIILGYSLAGKTTFFTQFILMVTNSADLLKAFIAFLIFSFIVFSSIVIVRRKLRYEHWYYIHILTYLAVLLSFGHQLKLGGDFVQNAPFVFYWYALYSFVFGNVLIFRFLLPVYRFFENDFTVTKVVRETKSTVSIYIYGKKLESLSLIPGQFIIVQFLKWPYILEHHPFSVSLVPKENTLRLTIRQLGDFTKEIDKIPVGTKVLIDGPFGVFTHRVAKRKRFLFLAGGIGITPIRAMIEGISTSNKEIVLLYSNKNSEDVPLKAELDELSVRYGFAVHYIFSDDKDAVAEKGVIDSEKIKRLVPDFKEREIFLCGPPPMMKSVVSTLESLGVSKDQVHFELFSLA